MQKVIKNQQTPCHIKVIDIKNCFIIEQIEVGEVMHQIMHEKGPIGILQRDDMQHMIGGLFDLHEQMQ
jgi:hypothetical protein